MKYLQKFIIFSQLSKWFIISGVVGILSGLGSAALLASLEWATDWRESHIWIIALLPVGGFLSGWLYYRYGKPIEAGNNLLLEEIHNSKKIIPLRMAPMVLFGTTLTHLFGGSAGREGTALQIAASLADQLTKIFNFKPSDRRILLMAGLSGGFASVFGTPLAGTIFGLEVLAIGTINHSALFPCLVAAIVGDRMTLSLGLHHTAYRHAPSIPSINLIELISAISAGIVFGLAAMVFAKLTHRFSYFFKSKISYAPLRPAIGGVIVALIVWALGSTKYIGLGIPTIVNAFEMPLPPWDFAAKIGLTALTLGAGFKGGEVTPLFFIGATLGNALSLILPLSAPLLAGMGFVAVFGGAANTPIAATLMGIELFGIESGIFVAIACTMSYLASGHSGIYSAQQIGSSKYHFVPIKDGLTLAAHALETAKALEKKVAKEIHLFNDLHFWGFVHRGEEIEMNDLTALRLYFHFGARLPQTTFWQKLNPTPLAYYLATRAEEFGIEQVVVHRVSSGFLKGDALSHDNHEFPPHRLPQCLELVDQEDKLRSFLAAHTNELKEVRVVLLRCEELTP
ncbi:voltage-gated chloride channel family protein (plasmid) [Pseudanabaena biceps]|nr:voltage-gated chloride channel family protein [Pseudanabaena biceps]